MRKLLALWALLCFVFGFTPPADAASRISGVRETDHTSGQDSSNATVTVVADPGDSYTIRIYKLIYHVNGADNVTLSCGAAADAKSKYTFGAEGGVAFDYHPDFLECDSSTAVTLTKGTAGTLLEYDIWTVKEPN